MSLQVQKGVSQNVRYWFIALALVISFAYDYLIWNKAAGLGFFVFVGLSLTLFTVLVGISKKLKQKWALLLLLPILLMSFSRVLLNNDLVIYYVPWFVFFLSIIFVLLLTLNNPEKNKFTLNQIAVIRNLDWLFFKIHSVLRDIFVWKKSEKSSGVVKRVLLGVVISIPFLVVFVALFSQADVIFSDFIDDLFNVDYPDMAFWRVLRTILITILGASFFYNVLSSKHILGSRKLGVQKKRDSVVWGTILALINLVFLAFVLIQIKYMFGNANYVFEKGMSYADYARSGFFELVWAMVISALLLLFVYYAYNKKEIPAAITVLKLVLVLQLGVVAVSALRRMYLYQDAYGFTVLRLYVEWFIYFALIIMIITAISFAVRVSFRRLVHTAMVLGVLALTVISLVNVDLVIAKENVNRFINQDKEIDVWYLNTLSVDAIAAVEMLLKDDVVEKVPPDQVKYLPEIIKNINQTKSIHDKWQEYNYGVNSLDLDRVAPEVSSYYHKINSFFNIESQLKGSVRSSCYSFPIERKGIGQCVTTGSGDQDKYVYQLIDNKDATADYYVWKEAKDDRGNMRGYEKVYSKRFETSINYKQNNQGLFLLFNGGDVVIKDFTNYSIKLYPLVKTASSIYVGPGQEVKSIDELMKTITN